MQLLHDGGATPARCTLVFYGGCAGEDGFADLIDNLARVLEGAREQVIGAALLDAIAFDRALAEFRDWGTRSDAALWYSISWAEGVRG